MSIRRLVEQPVPGGERFSAVIGPVQALRAAARLLPALALATAALAAVLAIRPDGGPVPGLAPAPFVWTAATAFLASVAVGCLGGREHLVCEGHHVIHRRAWALGPRRRTIRVLDLTAVRPPGGRLPVLGGIRMETTAGTWTVARHLAAADSELLVESLRLHLSLSRPVSRARPAALGAARPHLPAPITPVEALRHRLPEG